MGQYQYQDEHHQDKKTFEEPYVQETDGFAVTSLVSGIVSVVMLFCGTGLGIIPGVVAVTTGIISKKQEGKKCTTAKIGILLGIIGIILPIPLILFVLKLAKLL